MKSSAWEGRIARAEELACTHSAAAELLRFYAEIARFQKSVYDALGSAATDEVDTTALIPHFPRLLSLVKRIGPSTLAEAAGEVGPLQDLLIGSQDSAFDDFFRRALLQPYMEYKAGCSGPLPANSGSACPFCGERPQVGVLRQEGDGGKRSLICSLCSTEWEFRRIVCPGCGEEAVDKLPVYTAAEFDYVRVEACDSCHSYIKSVDLTKNGLASPVVDELATLPLTVWAEGNGYTKLQLNLLGM
jgi:FdhE protein